MSEEDSTKKNHRLCGLCEKNESRYCCPRCEVFYCSLDCYKSDRHLECSENFYKECVNNELALNTVDNDSKKKMMEILHRIQNEDLKGHEEENLDSDDDNEIDLPTRLKNINLDDADSLWSVLTNDERNEFKSLLNGNTVGDIVPHWEPWWMYRREKKLVEDIEQPNNEDKILNKCPTIKVVPKFSSLTNVKPAPSIRVNIINVLSAYSFVMRYFNGEVDPVEAVTCILNICDSLNSNSNFEEPDVAVEAVSQKCLQSDLIETDEDSLEIMRHDTFLLYQGPNEEHSLYYTKSALSDLLEIFSKAKSKSKIKTEAKSNGDFSKKFPEHDNSHLPLLDISKVKKCIKKLEFYISFLNTCNK